ncbi:MAG: enoyl-CoA hydratase/isomerase family protein, partial [Rhodocyclaceae bacterium]
IAAVAGRPLDAVTAEETAQRIARQRMREDAREGFAAFLQKRPPAWMAGSGKP